MRLITNTFYIIIIIIFFLGCKNNTKEKETINNLSTSKTQLDTKKETLKNKYKKTDFDFILKDREYTNWYDEGVLILKHNYLPNYNDIGNVTFYFISKDGAKNWEKQSKINGGIEKVILETNSFNLKKFLKEFSIFAFIIDKSFLVKTSQSEMQYNINNIEGFKYKLVLYTYENSTQNWVVLNSFETLETTSNKAYVWEKEKIKELVKKSNESNKYNKN